MKLNRRMFFYGCGAAALGLVGLKGLSHLSKRPPPQRPNTILFIADDMRYDAAGFAGNSVIRTPHLDRLAQRSSVFSNAFVTTSICIISRASIYSGQYALQHGVYAKQPSLTPESIRRSVFMRMRRAGYYTGFIGKWSVGDFPHTAFHQHSRDGSEPYYLPGNEMHLTDRQTQKALHFLESVPEDRPFLLIMAYLAAHEPHRPQARFSHLYDDLPAELNPSRGSTAPTSLLFHNSIGREKHEQVLTTIGYRERIRQYYQMITGIDDSVGTILKHLRSMGIMEYTNILFTSDNGFMYGEHQMQGKALMYEESIRVPMLIHAAEWFSPRLAPGVTDGLALNIDIAPTMLALSNMPVPPSMQGKSLLPVMRNGQLTLRDGFYYEIPESEKTPGCEGYRGRRWKYARYFNGGLSEEHLFDLKTDPKENTNLALNKAYAKQLQRMRRMTLRARQSLQKPVSV